MRKKLSQREERNEEHLNEMLKNKPIPEEEKKLITETIINMRGLIIRGVTQAIENTFINFYNKVKLMPNGPEKHQIISNLMETLNIIEKSSQFPEINTTIAGIKKIFSMKPQEYEPYDVPKGPFGGPFPSNENNSQIPQNNQEN
jgi:hypothetical protein